MIGWKQMEENKRLYPISEEVFNGKILPVIEESYIWKGRPPKVSHYKVFCGILCRLYRSNWEKNLNCFTSFA
jgi:hypothetical protein